MACFLAPMAEAIVVTVVKKIVDKKELQQKGQQISASNHIEGLQVSKGESETTLNSNIKISWGKKLGWLRSMLWGGVLLLAFEHVWHGEVVPWPPFLTAMENPADISPMLHEIATIGVSMALFVTVIWIAMVAIADRKVTTATQNLINVKA